MEVLINTAIDVALLYYENKTKPTVAVESAALFQSKVNLVTDAIFLGLGNFVLSEIANPYPESLLGGGLSNRLNTSLKAAYYPVSSALMFSAYSNMMYNNSYIRSLSISAPIMIGETYINYKMMQEKKQEAQTAVQTFFKGHDLLGRPVS